MDEKCYFVYVLYCENDTYYTGYTTDLTRRYQEHKMGSVTCKYTRSFKPLRIAQSWQIVGDKGTALKMEKFIKRMSKKDKEKCILFPELLTQLFQCKPFFIAQPDE